MRYEAPQESRAKLTMMRMLQVHLMPNGSALLRFQALGSAIDCHQAMQGRWFDGRQIEAQFDPSTPEIPQDDETKLQAFLASLE